MCRVPERVEVEERRGSRRERRARAGAGRTRASARASRWIPAPAFTPDAYDAMRDEPARQNGGADRTACKAKRSVASEQQRRAERERDHGDDGHPAEVAGRQPARERRGADERRTCTRWASRAATSASTRSASTSRCVERGVLGTREVPGEDDEDDARPCGTRGGCSAGNAPGGTSMLPRGRSRRA